MGFHSLPQASAGYRTLPRMKSRAVQFRAVRVGSAWRFHFLAQKKFQKPSESFRELPDEGRGRRDGGRKKRGQWTVEDGTGYEKVSVRGGMFFVFGGLSLRKALGECALGKMEN